MNLLAIFSPAAGMVHSARVVAALIGAAIVVIVAVLFK
jgi:hypothetical protein